MRRLDGALGLGALVVAAVLAAGLVAILAFGAGESRQDVYLPVGYVEEVERLVATGKLRYDCREDRIEPAGLSPSEETFYLHSYLADDVAAWNAGDRRPFLVEREESRGRECEGRITGVNPSFHNQRLPGYVAEAWRGSLYLRPVLGGTTLASGRHTFEVSPVPWRDLPEMDARAYEDAWLRSSSRSAVGGGTARAPRLALKLLERGRPFGTLKYIGDQAVFEVEGERPQVLLDGCPVPLGWRVRLDGGEALSFQQPRVLDERFAVEAGERAGLVSFLTRVNGEPERRSYPERLPMAREVARAVDSVVAAARRDASNAREDEESEGATARDDFDVHLTVDPFLTDRLEERMARVLSARYGRRPLRAGVTVLDAGSGRLLALASYPRPDDLDALGLGADGAGTPSSGAAARRELLRQNHNFLQHAAGSAAKPFLTAAILAAEPRLADLRVRCFGGGEPPESVLGYALGEHNLPGDCQGAGPDGWVDLESFLTVSSNRYMLYLGLLSMSEWGPEGPLGAPGASPLPESERYQLGGRTFSRVPDLRVARAERTANGIDPPPSSPGAERPPTELQEVDEQGSFGRAFRDLFDQRVRYRRERTAEAFDLRPWEPVVRAAYGLPPGGGPTPRPDEVASFAPIASERVNLRLNLVQQLRQDLYTLLLGNGANRWSNVQLAEAMARLVTGRAVEARLVERVVVPPERSESGGEEVLWALDDQPEPPNLADRLADPLRERILAGMRGVVEAPQGTAAPLGGLIERLNRRAPPGVRYSAVAKTGTPTLPLSVARRTASDIHPEAVKRYGEGQDRQVESAVLVLAVRREAPAGEGTEDLAVAVYIESQGGSREAVTLAATLLEPLVESRWPDDFL